MAATRTLGISLLILALISLRGKIMFGCWGVERFSRQVWFVGHRPRGSIYYLLGLFVVYSPRFSLIAPDNRAAGTKTLELSCSSHSSTYTQHFEFVMCRV